jgi:hypothetical protein
MTYSKEPTENIQILGKLCYYWQLKLEYSLLRATYEIKRKRGNITLIEQQCFDDLQSVLDLIKKKGFELLSLGVPEDKLINFPF